MHRYVIRVSTLYLLYVGCSFAGGEKTEGCRGGEKVEGGSSEAVPQPVPLQSPSGQAKAGHHSVQKGHGVRPQECQGTLSARPGLSVCCWWCVSVSNINLQLGQVRPLLVVRECECG